MSGKSSRIMGFICKRLELSRPILEDYYDRRFGEIVSQLLPLRTSDIHKTSFLSISSFCSCPLPGERFQMALQT